MQKSFVTFAFVMCRGTDLSYQDNMGFQYWELNEISGGAIEP